LGITRTLWLGKGIAGDDTHGHIDDLARFVKPDTLVLCEEKNPRDANYAPLRENAERLQGSGFEVIRLPMPQPIFFDGRRLPASYANFYLCNAAVLVPTFADPADRIAMGILAELFKDREVVGIPARDLVWGLGTLHCLSQQEPR
jgi:agmatine deiminase